MNVIDKLKGIYGNEVYMAACLMDEDGADKIEAAYQEAWDEGRGFTFQTMFAPRTNEEAEAKACAQQMQSALKNLIQKTWLSRQSRSDIIALCNILATGPSRLYTKVRLISDLELETLTIAREWSELHPDEMPVYPPDPDIA